VDEIVAEALRAHRKKFDWQREQDNTRDTTQTTTSIPHSAKDMAATIAHAVTDR